MRPALINTATVARLLGLDPAAIVRLVHTGRLKRHPSSTAKKVLVAVADVEGYVGYRLSDAQILSALAPKHTQKLINAAVATRDMEWQRWASDRAAQDQHPHGPPRALLYIPDIDGVKR